jgi:DNA-binding transcriptional LysR family regulator
VTLRSLSSPEQIVALQNREINLGFLRGPIEDDEIVSEAVLREDVVAVLPAKHPLASRRRIPLPNLTELPLIQMSRSGAPALHDMMDTIAASAGIRFRVICEMDNLLTLLNAIAAGRGFSLLSAYVEGILPKNVVVRPLALYPTPQLEILIAYRKDDTLPALAYFLKMLRKK